MVTTRCDEGDNNKDVGDSIEELITAVECDVKCQARQPVDHFKKLLKATDPNHTYLVRHKLKESTMMKNYMTMRTFATCKKSNSDLSGKATTPFPEEKAVMSIYGGPATPRVAS
jgi:hypothetical protein